jgi:hypothetical protein
MHTTFLKRAAKSSVSVVSKASEPLITQPPVTKKVEIMPRGSLTEDSSFYKFCKAPAYHDTLKKLVGAVTAIYNAPTPETIDLLDPELKTGSEWNTGALIADVRAVGDKKVEYIFEMQVIAFISRVHENVFNFS